MPVSKPSNWSTLPAPVGLAFVDVTDRVCSPGAKDTLRWDSDSKERVGPPITHGEMRALLEPLHSCLACVEKQLQVLARTPPLAQERTHSPQPSQDSFGKCLVVDPIQGQTHFPTKTQLKSNLELREPLDECSTNQAEPPNLNPLTSNGNTTLSAESVQDGPVPSKQVQGDDLAARIEIDKVLQMEGLADEIPFADRLALRMGKSAEWWYGWTEPTRNDCASRLVKSPYFENLCILVILLNSALVAHRADWEMQHIGSRMPVVLDVLESACFFWFLTELLLRIVAHRQYFFFNDDALWNLFDLILVAISIVDFVFSLISRVEGGNNVAFMRVLRLLKLAKIFRSLRSFRFFKSLEMLLESFQRSLVSLFWGLVMLTFVLYVFSLIFMQGCLEYLTSESDKALADDAVFYFGSFGRTFLSLYMSVTGGDDWINLYQIMEAAGWVYGLLIAFFTFFFLFAIFNILTGALVDKAMQTSKPDRTDMIMRKRKKAKEERDQFMKLCKALDHDGDGNISLEEFTTWMGNEVMHFYMQSIGVEIDDVEVFFSTVAAREGRGGTTLNAGEVTIDHFVEGCMHMKGTATALDMQRQLFEMHVLHHDLQVLEGSLTQRLQCIEELIAGRLIS